MVLLSQGIICKALMLCCIPNQMLTLILKNESFFLTLNMYYGNMTTFTTQQLIANSIYSFNVVAANSYGNSTASTSVQLNTSGMLCAWVQDWKSVY